MDSSFSLKSSQPLERRQGCWADTLMLLGIWADCPTSLGYPGGDCSLIHFDLMDIRQCSQSKADILLSQCQTLFWGCVSGDPSTDISSSCCCEVPIASSSCSSCGTDCCGQRSTTPCPDASSSAGGSSAGSSSAEKSIKSPVSGTGVWGSSPSPVCGAQKMLPVLGRVQ
ncbi:unnamed protein product [Staurois parvus]|uniref:Uncharacterized protein n=1 Tax=Staurois parvus TaxID=386267 RepID=A0ABN9B4V0_9NEOB|nr:unnamed protein product [Staurois parvus]